MKLPNGIQQIFEIPGSRLTLVGWYVSRRSFLSCRHLNCQVFTCELNLIKRSVPDKFHPRQLNCVSGVHSLPNTSDADKCCPLLFSVKQRRINVSTSRTDSLSSDQTLQTTNTQGWPSVKSISVKEECWPHAIGTSRAVSIGLSV